MARIKGWEKQAQSKVFILWTLKDSFYPAIEIRENYFGLWNVYLLKETKNFVLKENLTKSQAIRFAKNWMKRHPNG